MANVVRKIELRKIRVWEEKAKDSGYPDGTLRIYVGGMWMGSAIPDKASVASGDVRYRYHVVEEFVWVSTNGKSLPLQEILDELEVKLKEFAVKFVRKLVVFKPLIKG